MDKLVFARSELLAEHDYARPNQEFGRRMHGGYDASDQYISPRTLNRWPAIRAWEAALAARGGEMMDLSNAMTGADTYPSVPQQRMLLECGFGQIFWDALTKTGVIEGRAASISRIRVPDMQAIIDDDVSGTATGHLGLGLMEAHGMDEAGDPARADIGAHDAMWFATRDIAFGEGAYPVTAPVGNVFKPVFRQEMPQIPPQHEQLIKYLMNVLMLELRGEVFFDYCKQIFENPEMFADHREAAAVAARIVSHIRQDEASHIRYLQLFFSELRAFKFRSADGLVVGASFIDPVWKGMTDWHAAYEDEFAERRRLQAEEQIEAGLGQRASGVLTKFRELAEVSA